MDIKAKITETIEKITGDKSLIEKFKKDPIKTVESVIGVDLPDEIVNKIIDLVKTKINIDSIDDVTDMLGGLFGKKD